jgi:hypothetical protein
MVKVDDDEQAWRRVRKRKKEIERERENDGISAGSAEHFYGFSFFTTFSIKYW